MKKKHFAFLILAFLSCSLFAQQRTLDFYIGEGLKNSPLLKDYSLQIASNGIDSLKVKAAFLPQVNLNGQLYYAPNFRATVTMLPLPTVEIMQHS